jgi:PEP-CTERM motif
MKQFIPALALFVLVSTNLRATTSDFGAYSVNKFAYFNQTSVAGPSVSGFYANARVFPNSPTGVSNPTIQPPLSGPLSMIYSGSLIGTPNGYWYFQSTAYPTQAALDAALPDGSYQFSIPTTSGTALTYTPTITQASNYPGAAPTITNTTWNGPSLTLDYTVANTITWNNPGVVSSASLNIVGSSGDNLSFSLGAGATSQIIAANGLNPNESYRADLIFSNITTDTIQIPGATGTAYNSYNTFFNIVPEPSSCAMLVGGLGLLGLAVRRKCVKA